MKIFSYSPYDDTGGFGWRMSSAFDKYGPAGWEYRAVRGAPSYLRFPAHDKWHWPSIVQWWNQADVVHVHDHIPAAAEFDPTKPKVVTFHGTGFRESPAGHVEMAKAAGARPLVSTLDLWLQAPEDTTWCPQIEDIDWLSTFRVQQAGPIRIAHAPTNRLLKSTDQFLTACDELKSAGADIEVVLIERKRWTDALTIKGTCDILFDQTAYGYGGNALEAWGMGIPVICGAPLPTLNEYMRRFGELPFVLTERHTIRQAIEQLLDPKRRQLWGETGRAHVAKWHSYQAGVARLTRIYEEVTA